jgi:hypothetical protein
MRLFQISHTPPGPVGEYLGEWVKYLGSKFPRPWEKQAIYDWRGRCKLCGKEKEPPKKAAPKLVSPPSRSADGCG